MNIVASESDSCPERLCAATQTRPTPPDTIGAWVIGVVTRRMRAGLEVFGDGAAFGGGPGGIVGDHAGGFPVAGEHRFGCGGAPGGEFTGEPDAATVRGEAALDPGGARQRATPICSPCLPTAPTKCVSEVATARLTASTAWNLRGRPASGSLAPASHPDAFLALQVDGPVVLDAAAGARLWHTGPRHLRGDRSMSAGVNIASRLSQPRALNAPAPSPDTVSGRFPTSSAHGASAWSCAACTPV